MVDKLILLKNSRFNKSDVFIMTILVLVSVFGVLLKSNIALLIESLFIGILFVWYIYINEKRLMIFTILGILSSGSLSILAESLINIQYFIMILLCIKLLEKKIIQKQKIRFNKIIVMLSLTLFIINIISLIYNHYDTNAISIIFYSLKKFSFLILYLFFINADVTKKDIDNNMNIIVAFAMIQFVIVTIQFYGGIRQDDLVGMFGKKSTGIVLQFMTIVLTVITVLKDKFIKIPFLDLIVMMFCLIYSALGEVKLGFIIIPFIYILALLLKREITKLIITMVLLFFSFNIIYAFFIQIYPNQDILVSASDSEQYLENAYGSDQVNRMGFLPLLKSTVIDTTEKQLFGTGLSTINTSNSSILKGSLDKKYGYLNISYFALTYAITENGFIGTFIWLMIYIYILIINLKEYLINKSDKSIINILLIIDTFIFIGYNNAIFASYHVILALWFVISYFYYEEFVLSE